MSNASDVHEFCRTLHTQVMKEVRKRFTKEQIAASWVWDTSGGSRKSYEFHGPNSHYDHNLIMSDCKWSATAEGWQRLMDEADEQMGEQEGIRHE
jgi:hypothetical protein